MEKITIQGVSGAFHEIAARQYFGAEIEVIPALSFPELFDITADAQRADGAMLAIENSIAGSILGNFGLLTQSSLRFVGEVYLRIQQNLLALPGVSLPEIREVHSHPMALAQCAEFFKAWPGIQLVESDDTAESAASIQRNQSRHIGAIASTLAAEIYGLQVLAPAIETVPENYTRFLALRRENEVPPLSDADKATVCFTLPHQPGSLATVLGFLAASEANLTKIQSVPLLGSPWEYQFYVDFTAPPAQLPDILSQLKTKTASLQILGTYQSGRL